MSEFYLTLPSTASMSVHRENTQSNFTVQLPHTIDLKGRWVAALSEIQLPSVFFNIDSRFDTFTVNLLKPRVLIEEDEIQPQNVITDLIASEMHTGPEFTDNFLPDLIAFMFSERYRRNVTITEEPAPAASHRIFALTLAPGYQLKLHRDILKLLGWEPDIDGYVKHSVRPTRGCSVAMLRAKLVSRPFTASARHVEEKHEIEINIPHGCYSTVDLVLSAMRRCASDAINKLPPPQTGASNSSERQFIEFSHLKNQKVSISCEVDLGITFPKDKPGLGQLLGFSDTQLGKTYQFVVGDYAADIKGGNYGFYVYSSLIKDQICGDVRAPLLRVIPLTSNADNALNLVKIYDNPDFYELNTNTFDSVHILICNDQGEAVRFINGKTVVKLVFKRKDVP